MKKKAFCFTLCCLMLLCSFSLVACGDDEPDIFNKTYQYIGADKLDVRTSYMNDKSVYNWIDEFINEDTLDWDNIYCDTDKVTVSQADKESLTTVDQFVNYFKSKAEQQFASAFCNAYQFVDCTNIDGQKFHYKGGSYTLSGSVQTNYEIRDNNSTWIGTLYVYTDDGLYLTLSPCDSTTFNEAFCEFSFRTKAQGGLSDSIALTFYAKFKEYTEDYE